MERKKIDIKGLDKVTLLKKLWDNAISCQPKMVVIAEFDFDEAKESIDYYLDYFCGRPIKCNLSKDLVDPFLYDENFGEGAFKNVVDSLRSGDYEKVENSLNQKKRDFLNQILFMENNGKILN